jgi:hypothetical protein
MFQGLRLPDLPSRDTVSRLKMANHHQFPSDTAVTALPVRNYDLFWVRLGDLPAFSPPEASWGFVVFSTMNW